MKKIVIFNHKGGVSKTTTTYHLGWMLAELDRKVLLIDADSQCNLSLTVFGEDGFEEFVSKNPDNNIKAALSSAFQSKPELINPVDCVNVKKNPNLFLLPGNFEITEFDVQLGVSFNIANSFTTMKNLPGAFNYLIEKTAEKYDIDVVLIDVNPSLSAINQALFISSDYFIVPAAPDYFSKMAIKSLSRVLPSWVTWAKNSFNFFSDSTYPLPNSTPQFLGYTINSYTLRSGEPARSFGEIIDEIDALVRNEMIPSFQVKNMMLDEAIYSNDYCLAKISNFQTLQAIYQKNGIPVFTISESDLGHGTVLENQMERVARFKKIYELMANKILTMI